MFVYIFPFISMYCASQQSIWGSETVRYDMNLFISICVVELFRCGSTCLGCHAVPQLHQTWTDFQHYFTTSAD